MDCKTNNDCFSGKLRTIDLNKLSGKTITFGTKVKIVDEETDQETDYQMVGPYEANLELGLISIASPIAKALIGKEKGSSVEVKTPSGSKNYEIISICLLYTSPSPRDATLSRMPSSA